MKKDYTFAVARIRGREMALLSNAALEQLLASTMPCIFWRIRAGATPTSV